MAVAGGKGSELRSVTQTGSEFLQPNLGIWNVHLFRASAHCGYSSRGLRRCPFKVSLPFHNLVRRWQWRFERWGLEHQNNQGPDELLPLPSPGHNVFLTLLQMKQRYHLQSSETIPFTPLHIQTTTWFKLKSKPKIKMRLEMQLTGTGLVWHILSTEL